MPLNFLNLTAEDLSKLVPSQTIFLFGLGALEDHGPHLPLGQDVFIAEQVCLTLARKLESEMGSAGLPMYQVVLMPALPLGIETHTHGVSLRVRPHVMRDWLVDSCLQLSKLGFFYFVAYSGHPGPKQLVAIDEAGRILRRKTRVWLRRILGEKTAFPSLMCANFAQQSAREFFASPFWSDPEDHGGVKDTSIALRYFADQVRPNYSSLPKVDRPSRPFVRLQNYVFRKNRGYWGAPALALPKMGEDLVAQEVEAIYIKIKSVLAGVKPRLAFQDWYALWPGHKSFFKAWALGVAFAVVMMIWLYVNLSFFMEIG